MAEKKETQEKKERAKVDPNETPSQRFVRLARFRTLEAIKRIATLENLSGSAYQSTQAQRDAIIAGLTQAVQQVKVALNREKAGTPVFDLPEADSGEPASNGAQEPAAAAGE